MNEQPFNSDSWANLAPLKPRLRPHARMYRHHYRGQPWYVLVDELSANYFHLPETVYRFINLLDGRRSVDQAWLQLGETDDARPGQYEVAVLLGKLRNADLLQGDFPTADDDLQGRQQRAGRARVLQRLRQPLVQRFALLDPDAFLARLMHWAKPLFSPAGFFVWLLIVAWALLQAGSHSVELTHHWSTRFMDPLNLLLLWLLYPPVKALHELAHGFATRVWGGEVHEMGIMFLVFMPLPYVNASAANGFYSKRRRMVVAAAGIMAELWLAGLALLAWLQLDPGLLRDACFNIAVIGSFSTLLFNGNPLLRFDGYYILMDLIEIPNLGTRSSQYLGYLLKRYLLGFSGVVSPVRAPGERAWLLAYGLASGVYRLFISIAIALYVSGKFFFVGVVLALWALLSQWLLPAIKGIRQLWELAHAEQQQRRLYLVASGAALTVFLGLFVLPVTDSSYAEGVINLPEGSVVRAGADGFVQTVELTHGSPVADGQLLFALSNDALAGQEQLLAARVAEYTARRQQVQMTDPLQAQQHAAAEQLAREELADLRARIARLQLFSPMQGTLSLTSGEDLPGRYVRQGDILAHVVDRQDITARVVVEQAHAERVRRDTREIKVKLLNKPGETLTASLLREVPQATARLPSRSLGTRGGGRIAVDARDTEGLLALDPVFLFDLQLPPLDGPYSLAHRVRVRFIHGREPLARQWLGAIHRFLIKKL